MRKMLLTLLIVCIVALLSTLSMPAVSAQPMKPLKCSMVITFDPSLPDPHWIGTVSGDINGKIEFWEKWTENYVVGKTEHFFEKFLITTAYDTVEGFDKGVWNFPTFKFRANGWVTAASGEWAYLIGYKMFEIGVTSPYPPIPPETVVHGTATMMLVYG